MSLYISEALNDYPHICRNCQTYAELAPSDSLVMACNGGDEETL
jgi:hypothetical protein